MSLTNLVNCESDGKKKYFDPLLEQDELHDHQRVRKESQQEIPEGE